MLTERDREILTWVENYKAISINQASILFFNNTYEGARRRLKQLEEMNHLQHYNINDTKEKIYYYDKKLSKHDLLILDFIATLKKYNCELLEYKYQPQYLGGKIRPDAFIVFKKDNLVYFILLEVDLHHYTSNSKMQIYECLYKTGELQKKCCGTFPLVIIARPTKGIRYNSNNFQVIYTGLDYNNIDRFLF